MAKFSPKKFFQVSARLASILVFGIFGSVGSPKSASATITLKVLNAGDQTQGVIFIPTKPLVVPAGGLAAFIDTDPAKTFTLFDVGVSTATDDSSRSNAIVMEVGSTVTSASAAPVGQQLALVVYAVGTNNTTKAAPIARVSGTDCNGGNCLWLNSGQPNLLNSGRYFAVPFTLGSVSKIAIYPSEVCQDYYTLSQGANTANGCGSAGSTVQPVSAPTPLPIMQFNFSIGYFEPNAGPTGSPIDSTGTTPYTFRFQSDAPQINCPTTIVDHYFPGDRTIEVDTSKFGLNIAGGAVGDRADRDAVIVAAKNGAIATFDSNYRAANVNDVVASLPISSSQTVAGFANSTNETPARYSVAFMVRDRGGLVTTGACGLYPVETSEVKGFLPKSQCFIATAAFRSGVTAPVLILRQFRDEILSTTSWGRSFINWYYEWSPKKALWLIDHPFFRWGVLLLLAPVIGVAWLALNPMALLVVLPLVFFVLWSLARKGSEKKSGRVSALFFIGFCHLLAPDARAGTQESFIERVKAELKKEDESKSKESSSVSGSLTPWIDRQQEKLNKDKTVKESSQLEGSLGGVSATPFIDRINKQSAENRGDTTAVNPQTDGTPYLKRKREELERIASEAKSDDTKESALGSESAIQAVADGKSELRLRRPGPIKHAVSVALGATASRGLTLADSGATGPGFADIYDSGWVADFSLHYEWQIFNHPIAGSFGIFGAGGISSFTGKGAFSRTLYKPNASPTVATLSTSTPYGARSNTAFTLLVIPMNLGINYRMNLLRYVQPFAMIGGSGVGMIEVRGDSNPNRWLPTFGLYYSGGVNLLLDWMSQGMTWELYDVFRIKHTYITGQFSGIQTFTGDVRVSSQVVYLGLTFEY